MWYKQAQTGFGGGILSPVELKFQQMGVTAAPIESEVPSPEMGGLIDNPVQEPKSEYEKRIWDALVNREDAIGVDGQIISEDGQVMNDGPAIESLEARRMSPYHMNPEETPMELQLESVRQQNVNTDAPESMSSTEGARGYSRVRGEFPYASGKGWTGYEDLPADKSWA